MSQSEAPAEAPAASRRGRVWIWGLVAAAALVLLLAALTIPPLLHVKTSAATAQNHLTTAVDAVKAGNVPGARAEVAAASAAMEVAQGSMSTPVLAVAAHVPVVGKPVQEANDLVGAASDTVEASAALVGAYASVSGKEGGTKIFANGTVDLARLPALAGDVHAARQHLDDAVAQLEQIDGGLLGSASPTVGLRDEALAQIAPLQQSLTRVDAMMPQLPDALGANGPRRYLLAVLNSGELRPSGGAPLSVALLTLDHGKLTVSNQGQTSTQIFNGNVLLSWEHATSAPFRSGTKPGRFAGATEHPDFRLAGEELRRAWAASGMPAVDGVIALDTRAVSESLRATGPVQTALAGQVTADNFLDKWIASYLTLSSTGERQSLNNEIATALIGRVTGGDGAFGILSQMATTAPGRHVQMYFANPELEQAVLAAGFGGAVSSPTGDHAAWFSINLNQSKSDVFSVRHLDIEATLTPDGGASVTQTMHVLNDTAPGFGGSSHVGYTTAWNVSTWYAYVPKAAQDVSLPAGTRVKQGVLFPDDGFGRPLVRTMAYMDAHESVTMVLRYTLPAGTFADGVYRLTVDPQPTVRVTTVSVRVVRPDGSVQQPLTDAPLTQVLEVTAAPGQ